VRSEQPVDDLFAAHMRAVDTLAPIFDFNSTKIACSSFQGDAAPPAKGSLAVNAGDNITCAVCAASRRKPAEW
jgi:hypothetical protein